MRRNVASDTVSGSAPSGRDDCCITVATAISAAPLAEDEIRALTERLEGLTGGKVELEVQVDPSLLGGLVVRVGDRLIDGSVRGRLERLRNRLVAGTL